MPGSSATTRERSSSTRVPCTISPNAKRWRISSGNRKKCHFLRLPELILQRFAFGDIVHGTLVEEDRSLVVADDPGIVQKPDNAAVFAANLMLEIPQHSVFTQRTLEIFTILRVVVEVGRDVMDAGDQLLRRVETAHLRQGAV